MSVDQTWNDCAITQIYNFLGWPLVVYEPINVGDNWPARSSVQSARFVFDFNEAVLDWGAINRANPAGSVDSRMVSRFKGLGVRRLVGQACVF